MLRSALKVVASCTGSISTASEDGSTHGPTRDRPLLTDPIALAPAHVRAIEPYQVGQTAEDLSREIGIPERSIVKLASNENPVGMSPKAQSAIAAAIGWSESIGTSAVTCYPDEHALRCDLARHHGVNPDQVILTNGSDELINTVARSFLTQGSSSVIAQYAYLSYQRATESVGARTISVPATHYGHDLPAMLRAITPDTRVVWVANPNNPTGNFIPADTLRDFVAKVPRDVVVVLDEAYSDYLPEALRYSPERWIEPHPNLVVAKTFSKIHGLAGLRIGYGLSSPQMVKILQSVRQTYSCSALSIAAARASLRDLDFLHRCRLCNDEGREQLLTGLRKLGLQPLPSQGNFITFEVPQAATVHRRLKQEGVIVRPLTQYNLPDFLRVSVGLPEQNTLFLDALERAMHRPTS